MTSYEKANCLIDIIEKSGYEAYFVGGCVRDYIMSRPCDDIDLTTSAKPNELEVILNKSNIRYIETGLKHGTVTAVFDKTNFEITTYRTDGDYLDSRHPENVSFVTNINEDLSRRDFTINAMAYNSSRGLVDLFGGKDDINNKIIKTVGDADKRFNEDALRIMRAIRFASVLGFDIDENTKKAIFANKELLKNVSAERIFVELSKLIMGDNAFNILMEYKEVLAVVVPELEPCFNVPQNTHWHLYDVWEHTCKAVVSAPKDLSLRLTMLLHDIGKPFAKTTDENGVDHFKGHQKISGKMADVALKRLKVSNEIYNRAMAVIPIHDMHIGTSKKSIKRMLSKIGVNALYDLIEVKRADKLAQNPEMTADELANLDITKAELAVIIKEGEAFKIKDLKINGNDLIKLGYKGREIGSTLELLLDKVIGEEVENEKSALIKYIIGEKYGG